MSGILDLTVAQLAGAIRDGKVSSREATEASVRALEEVDPVLNCLAAMDGDAALAEADKADGERAAGRLRGPLHGVPLAHKDMFFRAGRVSAHGTRIHADFVPAVTATALARLDAAGALDIARLNMVEFALGLTGHNPITGHPRNPWNTDHITAGSSSGVVAAVAARAVYASLGSDTGGSIRVPASCTNLVGLKPTYGRVSRAGAMPLSFSLDHVGPLARTAEDAALLLRATAGHDPADATTSSRPVPDYMAELAKGIRGKRIAVPQGGHSVEIAPDVQARLDESLSVLRDLGATVVPVSMPPLEPMNLLRRVVMMADSASIHRRYVATRRQDYNPQTLARLDPGFAISAVDYLHALGARSRMLESFVGDVFADADLLHLPTVPAGVPRIDDTDTGGDPRFVAFVNAFGHFIGMANFLGLPSIAVPVGFTGNGLPTSMQLIGRPFAESLLLRAAHAYEQATGWVKQKPPVCAA